MRVKIKLRDMGVKRQPKVWLIVQPIKKSLKGKYLERIGVWHPMARKTVKRHIAINTHRANYWLSVGAIPTTGAHRVLSRFGMLPQLNAAYGSAQLYDRPERVYQTTHFRGFGNSKFSANKVAMHYKQKLQEEMNLIERKRRLAAEAMANAGGPLGQAAAAIDTDAEDTDDIDSEEADIFQRTEKFERVLKKLNKHREENQIALRGNDLRYNVYLKKLNKLSRKDLGLDVAAYKDYVNNLKEFAHLNKDLNIFAAENLAINLHSSEKGFAQVTSTISQPEIQTHLEGRGRVVANSKSIKFTLAKFQRTNSGFITERDHSIVKELCDNMELYLMNEAYVADSLNRLYERRKREYTEMENHGLMLKELFKGDISTEKMKQASVSKTEYKDIKLLLQFDKEIFAENSGIHPVNDLEMDNPYSFFVNFERLPAKIPEKIKQMLYRPERMARLNQAYHRISLVLKNDWQRRTNERRDLRLNKNRRQDWHDRQPIKTNEELALIDKLVKAIETKLQISTEDGLRELDDKLTDVRAPIEHFTDIRDWYKPLLTRLIEERRKVPKAQRDRTVGDSVDEVDTTDLENWAFRGIWSELNQDGSPIQKKKTIQDTLAEKVKHEKQFRTQVVKAMFGPDANDFQTEEDKEAQVDIANMTPEQLKFHKKSMVVAMMQKRSELNDEAYTDQEDDDQDDKVRFHSSDSEKDLFDTDEDKDMHQADDVPNWPGMARDTEKYFEGNLRSEYKRIFRRHRIDMAKLFFGKDGGYTLREFKKWFKIEMEEYPERYTFASTKDETFSAEKEHKELEKIRKSAEGEGPIFADIDQERLTMLADLRDTLDKVVPKVQDCLTAQDNNNEEIKQIMKELGETEVIIAQRDAQSQGTIYEKARGAAATYQHSNDLNKSMQPTVLTPEHLRYLARQLKLVQVFAETRDQFTMNDGEGDEENQSDEGEENISSELMVEDPVIFDAEILDADSHVDDEVGAREWAKLTNLVDKLIGDKLLQSIENGGEIDVSELSYPDKGLFDQHRHLTVEMLASEIERLETEADQVEDKLANLSIKERAEWDKHYPFSIVEHDAFNAENQEAYDLAQDIKKEIEDGNIELAEGEKFDSEAIDAWGKAEQAKDKAILTRYAAELKEENPGLADIPDEKLELVLKEIIEKDGIEDEETAKEFFDEMWAKMSKKTLPTRLDQNLSEHSKPEYLDLNGKPDDFYAKISAGDNDYQSVASDEMVIDKDNYKKYQDYLLNSIGRYPHGYTLYENYASYSQVRRDATIKEYMTEMNRPCEFHEFMAILRQHMVEQSRLPEARLQHRNDVMRQLYRAMKIDRDAQEQGVLEDLSDEEIEEMMSARGYNTQIEEFLVSDAFVAECRKQFAERVQEKLVEKDMYKFVDALEETIDFWQHDDGDLFRMPAANTYIPVRNTIMKKPNLLNEDTQSDELGFRYNNYEQNKTMTRRRMHPLEQLSPLRGNRMGGGLGKTDDKYTEIKQYERKATKPTFYGWRRLSKIQSRHFSTWNGAYQSNMTLNFIPNLITAFNPFRQQ